MLPRRERHTLHLLHYLSEPQDSGDGKIQQRLRDRTQDEQFGRGHRGPLSRPREARRDAPPEPAPPEGARTAKPSQPTDEPPTDQAPPPEPPRAPPTRAVVRQDASSPLDRSRPRGPRGGLLIRVPNLDYAPDPVGQEVWKDQSDEGFEVRGMVKWRRIWHIGGFPMSIGYKVGKPT